MRDRAFRDYWILDVNQQRLHVLRSPTPTGYDSEVVLSAADGIAPLAFPDCGMAVGEMLRSRDAMGVL